LAKNKGTRSGGRRKRDAFPEVRGKVVERVEVSTSDGCAIGILFQDRTYLAFDVEPLLRITPDFSDWKTGNYKPLKRWRPVHSE
jgi:hypothetical protein